MFSCRLVVEIVSQFLHPYVLGDSFAFMPLMLISTYCAVGNIYPWISTLFFSHPERVILFCFVLFQVGLTFFLCEIAENRNFWLVRLEIGLIQ